MKSADVTMDDCDIALEDFVATLEVCFAAIRDTGSCTPTSPRGGVLRFYNLLCEHAY